MEGEISNFIKVWVQAIACLCYCYVVGKVVRKGIPTLLAILPIVFIFLYLPLYLHSLHLGGIYSFYISWLANSKLLLFAFNKGPLSDSSLSLKHFVLVGSLPLKIQPQNQTNTSPSHITILKYIAKGLIFMILVTSYKFRPHIPTIILDCLYCVHIYLILELIVGVISALVQLLLGVHLDPHFHEPYLASSLQDFWGRRWNLVVTNNLRVTIFKPTQQLASRVFGPQLAAFPAVFVTFLTSGLIHELIFYYLVRAKPTWEITRFFLLHGLCVIVELACKKRIPPRFRLARIVSAPLTIGFVMLTSSWLFFPQLLRCNSDQRALQEVHALAHFIKSVTRPFTFLLNALTSA